MYCRTYSMHVAEARNESLPLNPSAHATWRRSTMRAYISGKIDFFQLADVVSLFNYTLSARQRCAQCNESILFSKLRRLAEHARESRTEIFSIKCIKSDKVHIPHLLPHF